MKHAGELHDSILLPETIGIEIEHSVKSELESGRHVLNYRYLIGGILAQRQW